MVADSTRDVTQVRAVNSMPEFFHAMFAGEFRRAECMWAVPPATADLVAMRGWAGFVTTGSVKETEAAAIAQSASEKWEHEVATNANIATSIPDMKAKIDADGNAEVIGMILAKANYVRSEERRVGKECRSRWSPYH